ncbi:tRNA uracil 4-sulfurtransferase ThiI [Methanococcoides alaskense]|uniref:Probable tRNA sulfurtransferase n=1 Tax=Methanococcoides alaskense TaxID=325778 RepID=A0AA90TXS8_9EURY|nr:tRNA uracil 4-sulfurtransferase ThiI [Methanococcoides alaskense]MDA0525107.1 tRNA 4-thiouridine(8) synthase ThiI [Methanococcoides alaskense]MDR6221972.1 thiamine biosynthesis protein ThiI [Methanococcoides alaskense]
MFDVVIVRYGELALKSPGVRNLYERILVKNLEAMLRQKNVSFSRVHREWGRIFITSDDPEAAIAAADVFGVVSTSAAKIIEADVDEAAKLCADIGADIINEGESFGIRARRVGKEGPSSTDIGRLCGDAVWTRLESIGRTPKVDLSDPDRAISVEMRQNKAYVFTDIVKGVGGLPLGSQGTMIVLMSGGIDSPVAAWLMMKRGVKVIPVYANNIPFSDERALERAIKATELLQKWSPADHMKMYEVPHGKNLDEFMKKCIVKNTCLLCKRTMYRMAYEIMKKENADGIITGSSIGQVASQTAANMHAEVYGLGIPLYHPLIGLDKTEIIDIARRIGSYDISIMPTSGCGAVPVHPEVKATFGSIVKEEEKVDIDALVNESVSNAKVIHMGDE